VTDKPSAKNVFAGFFGYTGRWLIQFLEGFTDIIYLSGMVLKHIFILPFQGKHLKWDKVAQDLDEIGVRSLSIVSISSFSIGVVIVFILAKQLQPLGAETSVPVFVTMVLTRELAPLISGLVLAGKVGASITAKMGTQKVNEEILALEVMAIDPVGYLVAPKVIAALIMLPCLTIIADAMGLFGGFVVGTFGLGIDMDRYLVNTINALSKADIFVGLLKSFIFGIIISMIGSYEGIAVEGGAQEVGHATMVSVMTSTLFIIIFDAVITGVFYAVG
jgi:phospholipid/cholesterol/gamma-HCH transport system permease protein